jgi:hypothetical protein
VERNNVLYFHRNPVTDEIFYVGIGSVQRANKLCGRGSRWHFYVKKYGKPRVEIYKNNLLWYEALALESHFIDFYGRKKIDKEGVLTNLVLYGNIHGDRANI